MSPIGETLRAARDQKGLTLERVAEETNIAKRYLAALEAEDFSVFPGDPYAIGFLRNYADYLGLPADEYAAAFKNMRIQEQPVPIQDLIPRRRMPPIVLGGIGALCVLLLVGAGWLIFRSRSSGSMETTASPDRVPVEYALDTPRAEKRLFEGDSLIIASGAEKYKIVLAKISDAVNLDTPLGAMRLGLGEEGTIDFDKNGEPDLIILVGDFAKKDPSRGALMRFAGPGATEAAKASDVAAPTSHGAPAAPAAEAPQPPPPEPAPSASSKNSVLFEAAKSPYPFVVSVTFRGPCLFRYEVDRRDRDERYYHKGETITINANNAVKVWASNAQSTKVVVQASGGKSSDVDLGGAGEVAVKRIAWTQGESGVYALNVFDVD